MTIVIVKTAFLPDEYDDDAMADVPEMVEDEPDDMSRDFDALAPDADEASRHRLVEPFAQTIAQELLAE